VFSPLSRREAFPMVEALRSAAGLLERGLEVRLRGLQSILVMWSTTLLVQCYSPPKLARGRKAQTLGLAVMSPWPGAIVNHVGRVHQEPVQAAPRELVRGPVVKHRGRVLAGLLVEVQPGAGEGPLPVANVVDPGVEVADGVRGVVGLQELQHDGLQCGG